MSETYVGLVAALHGMLPATIPGEALKSLVGSMRGHMRRLTWAEPWLFQDVIFPLLRDGRASIDDACEIWVQELAALLEPEPKRRPELFERAREGQMTNIAAFLFAHSSPERQQASLKTIEAILKRQRRFVQQPLANTSNWSRWDDALLVSMWILAFARWGQYYLRERATTNDGTGGAPEGPADLAALSQLAGELAMARSIEEWRSRGGGKQGDLATFLDQVEKLLAGLEEAADTDEQTSIAGPPRDAFPDM